MAKNESRDVVLPLSNPSQLRHFIVKKLEEKLVDVLSKRKENLSRKIFSESLSSKDNITILKKIVSLKRSLPLNLAGGKEQLVDPQTAKMLLSVYGSLQTNDKQTKFEKLLSSDITSLMQLIDFGWKKVQ